MKKDRELEKKGYYERNKEKRKLYQREYNKAHPEYVRNANLKSKYGLTLEDYNRMFLEQDGKCAICERHQMEFDYKLYVDHSHETGGVRGLLCANCNTVLGKAFEDKEILLNAVTYLEKRWSR